MTALEYLVEFLVKEKKYNYNAALLRARVIARAGLQTSICEAAISEPEVNTLEIKG